RNASLTLPGRDKATYVTERELTEKYTPISVKDAAARAEWQREYDAVPETRKQDIHVISGAILPIWDRLKNIRGAQAARTTTEAGERIVGMKIPSRHVQEALRSLGVGVQAASPETTFRQVLDDGLSFPLASGLSLKKVKWHGNPAI